MVKQEILVVITNSFLESLAVSKYLEMIIKKEIKANAIISYFYTVLKAD
jgi:hypothetical protein